MHIITFYSYKGGVGRTMALVNVAAELVRRGRKVLVVDFDLEAPGLETYKHLQPPKPHLGIVEYVTEYRLTHRVPSLSEYIYEAKSVGKKGGRLWVMPAGRRDPAYHNALAKLDWQRLYQDGMGFLLFENTKKEWEEVMKPDYVLIDSRTGDTDVLGICTRQLPDSVVVMFTPNEQNLAGLKKVCDDIRAEKKKEKLDKHIPLHFVAANVPDLDDEHGILHRQMQDFRERLEFENLSGTILRYESLRLLDQSVVVLDKPKSRLARAYRRLTGELITDNTSDRDGAMRSLRRYAQRYLPTVKRNLRNEVRFRLGIVEEQPRSKYLVYFDAPTGEASLKSKGDQLDMITGNFLDDADILLLVAECRILESDFPRALKLLTHVLRLQPNIPRARYELAMCHKNLGNMADAVANLLDYLHITSLPEYETLRALRELKAIAPGRLAEALDLPAVQALNDLTILDVFDLTRNTTEAHDRCITLLRDRVIHDDGNSEIRNMIFELTGSLIADRRWQQAITLLEARPLDDLFPVEDVFWPFYLAMAYWGETGKLPEPLCRCALKRLESRRKTAESDDDSFDLFNVECWLLWGIGKKSEALHQLDRAVEGAGKNANHAFSFWRWDDVLVNEYLEDCHQLRRMIQGEPLRPAFLAAR